jgi:hypothetical protein
MCDIEHRTLNGEQKTEKRNPYSQAALPLPSLRGGESDDKKMNLSSKTGVFGTPCDDDKMVEFVIARCFCNEPGGRGRWV